MQAGFWHERWEKQQIGFHLEEVNPYLRQHWSLVQKAGAAVFVPLCGKSQDLLWLRSQGHPVIGVELSGRAIADFFRENDLPEPLITQAGGLIRWEIEGLVLYEGDFFQLRPEMLAGVQQVYDRAALIALPPEMRRSYISHSRKLLSEPVNQLLITLEYAQSQMDGPPFSVQEAEVLKHYGDRYQVEALCRDDVLADNPRFRDKGLQQLYERVYQLIPR